MMFPKKVKFRKWHTMRHNPKKLKVATRGVTVAFGSHGLKATTPARVRSNQIESARKVIARSLGKTGKLWVRVFPETARSKVG
jgi:large subunit ribosomal protein L16